MKRKMTALVALAVSLGLLAVVSVSSAEQAKRMTKEELKAMIGNPDLVVLDIRQGKDWTSSEHKIQGAVRENPGKPDGWATKYDKEKTVVLYCA